MIRILHMIGSLGMGGSQTMAMAVYRALDTTKFQFDFVVDTDEEGRFEQEILSLGGRIFKLPKFNGKNFKAVQRAWKQFFLEHPEYKILHSHVRSYASIFIPVAKKCGVKTIIHSHNTSSGKGIAAFAKGILQYPLRYQADYFFGCSELAGEWLFGKKITHSKRFYLMKNAVDLDRFAYDAEMRAKIRRELGVSEDVLLHGHVGRFNPQKNHRFLLECFSEIKKRRPKSRLILLGAGELQDEAVRQIQTLGLVDCVDMLGVRSNVEDYFCAMDVLLLPSLHEGLPVVVVEAQASGLMCFVSDAVTKEVKLSKLVQYLPIDQGTAPWVNAVEGCLPVREDVSEDIRRGGFCAKSSTEWLCGFYQRIIEK